MIGRSVSVSFSLLLPHLSISKHNAWFMIHKREKTHDNHAKLQFMNGSNFDKLSKRMHIRPMTKNWPFGFTDKNSVVREVQNEVRQVSFLFAKSYLGSRKTHLCSPSQSWVRQLKFGSPTQNSPNCSPSRLSPSVGPCTPFKYFDRYGSLIPAWNSN